MIELSATLFLKEAHQAKDFGNLFVALLKEKEPDLLSCVKSNMDVMIQLIGPGFKGQAVLMEFPLGKQIWGEGARPGVVLPGGASDIEGHQCHVMINLQVSPDKTRVLQAARILTRLSMMFVPMAVAWFPGVVYARGDIFQKMATGLWAQNMEPVPLWCQLGARPHGDTGLVSPETYGLFPFVGFDVVLPPQQVQSMSDVINASIPFVSFLMQSTSVFNEGDTMGTTPEDKSLILKKVGEHPQAPILQVAPNT